MRPVSTKPARAHGLPKIHKLSKDYLHLDQLLTQFVS